MFIHLYITYLNVIFGALAKVMNFADRRWGHLGSNCLNGAFVRQAITDENVVKDPILDIPVNYSAVPL